VLYKKLKVAVICTPLPAAYHSYGDHWIDGFKDIGCEVERFTYDQIPHLKLGYDLYFFVEIRYSPFTIPWYAFPRVLYSWDSHVAGIDMYEPYHECFDHIYLASKIDVDVLNNKKLNRFKWIPEACNPHVHKDLGLKREYPLGYIGNWGNESFRRNGLCKNDFINHLRDKYKDKFLWSKGVYGEDYCKEQNKINIMWDYPITYNVGTRIFESCASGCIPMWSNAGYKNGIHTLLKEGVNYIEYNDTIEDLDSKIEWAFNNPQCLEKMRIISRNYVLENHTYAHRALEILKDNVKNIYSFGELE